MKLRLRFLVPTQCWNVDIYDDTGALVLGGVAVVTGADLLEQFSYLGLGGQMLAETDHDTDAVPTFANLGTLGHLFWARP